MSNFYSKPPFFRRRSWHRRPRRRASRWRSPKYVPSIFCVNHKMDWYVLCSSILANAKKDKLMVGGHPVYSAYFEGGMGYRIDKTKNIAIHDEAETMWARGLMKTNEGNFVNSVSYTFLIYRYMVTSGTHYNNRCCFDYVSGSSF